MEIKYTCAKSDRIATVRTLIDSGAFWEVTVLPGSDVSRAYGTISDKFKTFGHSNLQVSLAVVPSLWSAFDTSINSSKYVRTYVSTGAPPILNNGDDLFARLRIRMEHVSRSHCDSQFLETARVWWIKSGTRGIPSLQIWGLLGPRPATTWEQHTSAADTGHQ